MKAWSIVGYTYQAETLCPACVVIKATQVLGVDAETALDAEAIDQGIDRMDEHSFDSDTFPKVIFQSSVEDGERCMSCGEEIG